MPMIRDPILEELDQLRAEQLARFNFEFESFYRDFKEQEKLLPQAVQPPPETPPTPRLHRTTGFAVRLFHSSESRRLPSSPACHEEPDGGP
jgi:hypothetical protein